MLLIGIQQSEFYSLNLIKNWSSKNSKILKMNSFRIIFGHRQNDDTKFIALDLRYNQIRAHCAHYNSLYFRMGAECGTNGRNKLIT